MVPGVVGDAVQDIVGGVGQRVGPGTQTGQVDPADHFAAGRVDARDAMGQPDVGVDLTLDPFQFVDVFDGLAVGGDGDVTDLTQRVRIQNADGRRAVAHVQA